MSELSLHRGSRVVERAELAKIPVPPATATWFPIGHATVLEKVTTTLQEAGFAIRSTQLGLSASNARFFGTLDLETPLATGVSLCVGVRNSTDKSFPIGFCAGSRVFICDNLAFRSEVQIARKHTRFGETRFAEAIALSVKQLHEFKEVEAGRITRMQQCLITDEKASHVLLQAFDKDLISYRTLPGILREWQTPSFEDFQEPTAWRLFNAFSTILTKRSKTNPQQFARQSIRICDLIAQAVDMGVTAEQQHVVSA
jgi:Domain of unknown function (DUF932)